MHSFRRIFFEAVIDTADRETNREIDGEKPRRQAIRDDETDR